MRGRPTKLLITLTPAERATLLSIMHSYVQDATASAHARIVLLRARGDSISSISKGTLIARHHIYKWLRRYQTEGIEGLKRKPYVKKTEVLHG